MKLSSILHLALSVGLIFSLAVAAEGPATEKIPPDKVVHPLLKGVSNPVLIPASRKDPIYPEEWRKGRLGGRVILHAVIRKSGSVGDIDPLETWLRVEDECPEEYAAASGEGARNPETKEPAGPEGNGAVKKEVPPGARRDFQDAAVNAVKQWKYRPGTQNGVPVDVYYTIIVAFTSCSASADLNKGPFLSR